MKKQILLSIFLIFAGLQVVCAQAPGFLGKRDIFRYDFYVMPAELLGGNNSNFDKFNTSHGFAYERVASRKSVLGANLMIIRFPTQNPTSRLYDHKAITVGFHGKIYPFYTRGWLAPIGPFFRYSFNFGNSSTRYQSHNFMSIGGAIGYSTVLADCIVFDFALRYALADVLHSAAGGIIPTTAEVYFAAEQITQTEYCKFHIGIGILLGKK